MARPYKITVTVTSEGNGETLQTHYLCETSADEQTHVVKNFAIDKAVTDAVRAAMETLAADFLKKPAGK